MNAASQSGQDPVRVVIVEDHGIVRAGLRMLLKNWSGIEVIGEASNRAEAFDIIPREQPDIVLLDVYLDAESSLSFLPQLLTASPRSKVIVLTAANDRDVHRRAVRLGAKGIVLKAQAASVLARAIEKVQAGEVWLDTSLLADLLSELVNPNRSRSAEVDPNASKNASLTERERQIVSLVGEGLQNKQIADRLSISEITVAHHLTSIFHKLGVGSRVELALYASRHKLIDAPGQIKPPGL